MQKTIEYQSTGDMARRASWHFLFRSGRGALTAGAIIMLFGISGIYRGDITWWLAWGALVLPLIIPLRWMLYVKETAKKCDARSDKSVSVTFADDSVHFHTSEYDAHFKWYLIEALWRFKTEWLILTGSKKNYTSLPTSLLDAELQDFIIAKIRENDGEII